MSSSPDFRPTFRFDIDPDFNDMEDEVSSDIASPTSSKSYDRSAGISGLRKFNFLLKKKQRNREYAYRINSDPGSFDCDVTKEEQKEQSQPRKKRKTVFNFFKKSSFSDKITNKSNLSDHHSAVRHTKSLEILGEKSSSTWFSRFRKSMRRPKTKPALAISITESSPRVFEEQFLDMKQPSDEVDGMKSMSFGSDVDRSEQDLKSEVKIKEEILDVDMADVTSEPPPRLINKAAYDKIAVRPKRRPARNARGAKQQHIVRVIEPQVNGSSDGNTNDDFLESDPASKRDRSCSPKPKIPRLPEIDVAHSERDQINGPDQSIATNAPTRPPRAIKSPISAFPGAFAPSLKDLQKARNRQSGVSAPDIEVTPSQTKEKESPKLGLQSSEKTTIRSPKLNKKSPKKPKDGAKSSGEAKTSIFQRKTKNVAPKSPKALRSPKKSDGEKENDKPKGGFFSGLKMKKSTSDSNPKSPLAKDSKFVLNGEKTKNAKESPDTPKKDLAKPSYNAPTVGSLDLANIPPNKQNDERQENQVKQLPIKEKMSPIFPPSPGIALAGEKSLLEQINAEMTKKRQKSAEEKREKSKNDQTTKPKFNAENDTDGKMVEISLELPVKVETSSKSEDVSFITSKEDVKPNEAENPINLRSTPQTLSQSSQEDAVHANNLVEKETAALKTSDVTFELNLNETEVKSSEAANIENDVKQVGSSKSNNDVSSTEVAVDEKNIDQSKTSGVKDFASVSIFTHTSIQKSESIVNPIEQDVTNTNTVLKPIVEPESIMTPDESSSKKDKVESNNNGPEGKRIEQIADKSTTHSEKMESEEADHPEEDATGEKKIGQSEAKAPLVKSKSISLSTSHKDAESNASSTSEAKSIQKSKSIDLPQEVDKIVTTSDKNPEFATEVKVRSSSSSYPNNDKPSLELFSQSRLKHVGEFGTRKKSSIKISPGNTNRSFMKENFNRTSNGLIPTKDHKTVNSPDFMVDKGKSSDETQLDSTSDKPKPSIRSNPPDKVRPPLSKKPKSPIKSPIKSPTRNFIAQDFDNNVKSPDAAKRSEERIVVTDLKPKRKMRSIQSDKDSDGQSSKSEPSWKKINVVDNDNNVKSPDATKSPEEKPIVTDLKPERRMGSTKPNKENDDQPFKSEPSWKKKINVHDFDNDVKSPEATKHSEEKTVVTDPKPKRRMGSIKSDKDSDGQFSKPETSWKKINVQDFDNNNVKSHDATKSSEEKTVAIDPKPKRRIGSIKSDKETEEQSTKSEPSWIQLARRRSKVWEDGAPITRSRTSSTAEISTEERPTSLKVTSAHRTESKAEAVPSKSPPAVSASKEQSKRTSVVPDIGSMPSRSISPTNKESSSSGNGKPAWLAIAMQKRKNWETKEETV